jgi:predicted ATPase/KaiC/GvpD/RAD55 family RecA-like ATPase
LSSLERDHVPSPRPIAAKEVPLVDRVEEMNALKEAVYRAVHGEGGLVFIHGEAGIGKTRLVRELGAYARSRGVQVLYGRCPALFRMDGVPPYILWKEVIKDYLETCTPEQLYRVIGYYPAEVAKLVPELSQKLRSIPQSFPISPEQEQNRLFEAVSQFITNISRETPLLVVLDDLQWTDPSSLLLLHYLARGVQKTPLLLLGAYRSTDIDAKHPLTPVLAELNREGLPESIHLKRMSLSDVSEMIKNILEQEDVPSEFCKLVYEKTGGNPFFVGEVVKSLKEEGVIYREENRWEFKEVSKIEFPETVKTVIKTRIDRLDRECQNVLTLASFIGNDFTVEAMCAVTGIEENRLLELMDELFKTGLIRERVIRGEGVCSFADILVRDVVYEEVSPLRRKKLHGTVGRALEQVYAKKMDEHLGELASHFLESGDNDKALDYFLKAGEKARKVYANAEEASYLQSALRLLEEKEGELQEKASVHERLGDVEKLVGKYDDCVKHWNEALPLWAKLQKKDKTATLHRKMANVLWDTLGEKKNAKEHHEAALKILETEPESVELARLYEDMAHMHRRMGEFAEALPLAEKALALAEKLNALEAIALSCIELSIEIGIRAGVGDFKKAVEYANRALKIALENEYWPTALWAYSRLTDVLPMEEYEKRMDCAEKGLALAKKIGHAGDQSSFRMGQAYEYMLRGELDKAIAGLEEALAVSKRTGTKFITSITLLNLGEAYRMSGEWEKSEQYLREASDTAKGQDEWILTSFGHEDLGRLHLDKEEYVEAKESFEEALKVCEKTGVKSGQLYCSALLCLPLIELGELEKAQNLLDNFQSFALETEEKWSIVWSIGLKATLLRAQKKLDESVELFEKALREWEFIKANIWYAYYFARLVLCEYARAYLERNEEGDKEKACDLLNRALEMFQKMGAKKDVEKVEAKLLYIETGKVAPVPKPTELVGTGYADLDKLLCGGIPRNYAVALASPSCDERDSLVKSFLKTGAERGEVTFYVTIDPSVAKALAEEFQSNLHLFVCNPQADAIVKEAPNVFKLKGVENLTDISIALTSAIRKLDPSSKGPRRICISLVSDVLLQHHAVQTRRWLASLITELKSNGFTTLVTLNPQMHPSQELQAILDLFEGEISIYEKETEKGSEKFLKIKKMANQRYLKDELLLKEEDMQKRK